MVNHALAAATPACVLWNARLLTSGPRFFSSCVTSRHCEMWKASTATVPTATMPDASTRKGTSCLGPSPRSSPPSSDPPSDAPNSPQALR